MSMGREKPHNYVPLAPEHACKAKHDTSLITDIISSYFINTGISSRQLLQYLSISVLVSVR